MREKRDHPRENSSYDSQDSSLFTLTRPVDWRGDEKEAMQL